MLPQPTGTRPHRKVLRVRKNVEIEYLGIEPDPSFAIAAVLEDPVVDCEAEPEVRGESAPGLAQGSVPAQQRGPLMAVSDLASWSWKRWRIGCLVVPVTFPGRHTAFGN